MFDGQRGNAMTWDDLLQSAAGADVIILGEQHVDAQGHAVELAIVADVMERWPGTALSLEMLERDEQPLIDDYLDGIIDAEQFTRLTFSSNWGGGDGSWALWYQPLVDAAKDAGAPVIAANAPRRYVRLARTDGYERLDELTQPRREFFDHPDHLPEGPYRDRFWEAMSDHDTDDDANPELDDEMLESMFRSQLVWDATMAASIAEALESGASKVIHVVGQFHCDFEGGMVQQLRQRLPNADILVISLQTASDEALRDDDVGRADIVVYTGN